jgi:lysozyme
VESSSDALRSQTKAGAGALFSAFIAASCDVGEHGLGPYATSSEAVHVCAQGTMQLGVDVSSYQGTVDWARVAASGRTFGIAKATEGLSLRDSTFAANWAGMKRAGLVRAAYHFFHPSEDGATQADAFLAETGSFGPGDLPPMLDWEVTDGVSNAANMQQAQRFIDRIRARTGLTTIIYTYPDYWIQLGSPSAFASSPLWMASYIQPCPDIPAAWSSWAFWQDSGSALVPGISGQTDTDRFNGTLAQLQQMAGGTIPSSSPLAQVSGNDWISLISWPDAHVELFAKTTAGGEIHSRTSGSSDVWSSGEMLDTGAECGSAAAFWGAPWSYPELFSPRPNQTTAHLWWSGSAWNTYQDFGGMKLSKLSTLVGEDGRAEVFALGDGSAIWHNAWDSVHSSWAGWESLSGAFVSGASAIVWGDGTEQIFATDAMGAVWQSARPATRATGWSPWAKMGDGIASRPIPVRWSDGHVEVFARGLDAQLYRAIGSSPTHWASFGVLSAGTSIAGEPSAIMRPGNAGPVLFARGADGMILGLAWSGSFGSFMPLGQTAAADPFGWARPDGTSEVFAVDGSNQLVHTRSSGAGGWSPWAAIAQEIDPCASTIPSLDAGTSLPDASANPLDDASIAAGHDGAIVASLDAASGAKTHPSPLRGGCACDDSRRQGTRPGLAIVGLLFVLLRARAQISRASACGRAAREAPRA